MAAEPPPDGLIEWALGIASTMTLAGFSWVGATFRQVFAEMTVIRREARDEARSIASEATVENRDLWSKMSALESKLDRLHAENGAKMDRHREDQHQMELRLLNAIAGRPVPRPAE